MRGSRPHNPNAEYVIYDNIYFYKEKEHGYYLGNVRIPGRKRRYPMRLHIYIWQKFNGPIPEGYHVHHIDENKDNNDISNLQLIKKAEHLSFHAKEKANDARARMETIVRPKAIEWHKSDAAKEYHSQHYQECVKDLWLQPVTKTCEICGKEYTTTHAKASTSRFCSNNCKATFRRRSGADKIEYTCPQCGKTYMKYKYSKAVLCQECAVMKFAKSSPKKKADLNASNHPES